jgi:hypothetical protein
MKLNKFGPYSFYFLVFVDIIEIFSQCLEISYFVEAMASVFFFNFVMLLNWQSYMRIFSKNWQYSKLESRKIYYILSCCRQL